MLMVREQPVREEGARSTGSKSNRQPHRGSTLDPHTLDEIIRRVVEVAQPERIGNYSGPFLTMCLVA